MREREALSGHTLPLSLQKSLHSDDAENRFKNYKNGKQDFDGPYIL